MSESQSIENITIAGTGNVGWHMALAFHAAGIKIVNVVSRDKQRAESLAEKVKAKGGVYGDSDILPAHLTLICVPDDAIAEVASNFTGQKSILAHTSGSTGLEVFTDKKQDCGVLYPLQTFTQGRTLNYAEIPFMVEASGKEIEQKIFNLAKKISGSVQHLNAEKRKALHVSAVFACNFLNHMAVLGADILEDEGMRFDILRPLLKETFHKIETMSPVDAQTGPAKRGDLEIIKSHLKFLEEKSDAKELYRLLSASILKYNNKAYE